MATWWWATGTQIVPRATLFVLRAYLGPNLMLLLLLAVARLGRQCISWTIPRSATPFSLPRPHPCQWFVCLRVRKGFALRLVPKLAPVRFLARRRARYLPHPQVVACAGSLTAAPQAVSVSPSLMTHMSSVPPTRAEGGAVMSLGGGFGLSPSTTVAAGASAPEWQYTLQHDVTVTITPPTNNKGIARYSLAWGKNAVERLDGKEAIVSGAVATDSPLTYRLPAGSHVPVNATHLLAYVLALLPRAVHTVPQVVVYNAAPVTACYASSGLPTILGTWRAATLLTCSSAFRRCTVGTYVVHAPTSTCIGFLATDNSVACLPRSTVHRSFPLAVHTDGASSRVVQARFHPLSDAHVVVMTTEYLALYELLNTEYPVVVVPLSRAEDVHAHPVSFAFGGTRSFERFAVFVAWDDGQVGTICPLVPTGGALRKHEWLSLIEDVEDDEAPTDDDHEGHQMAVVFDWLQSSAWRVLHTTTRGQSKGSSLEEAKEAAANSWVAYSHHHDSIGATQPPTVQLMAAGAAADTSDRVLASIAVIPAVVCATPVVVRLFVDGHVDVLASVDPILPQWRLDTVDGGDNEAASAVTWTCLESVAISDAPLGSAPPPALEVDAVVGQLVYCQHRTGVYVVLRRCTATLSRVYSPAPAVTHEQRCTRPALVARLGRIA